MRRRLAVRVAAAEAGQVARDDRTMQRSLAAVEGGRDRRAAGAAARAAEAQAPGALNLKVLEQFAAANPSQIAGLSAGQH